jgi:hypothetical protein
MLSNNIDTIVNAGVKPGVFTDDFPKMSEKILFHTIHSGS